MSLACNVTVHLTFSKLSKIFYALDQLALASGPVSHSRVQGSIPRRLPSPHTTLEMEGRIPAKTTSKQPDIPESAVTRTWIERLRDHGVPFYLPSFPDKELATRLSNIEVADTELSRPQLQAYQEQVAYYADTEVDEPAGETA